MEQADEFRAAVDGRQTAQLQEALYQTPNHAVARALQRLTLQSACQQKKARLLTMKAKDGSLFTWSTRGTADI
eukprot:41743-Eustigmatos_ZCMA.PRE.1